MFEAHRFQKNLRTALSNMVILLQALFLYMNPNWQKKFFLAMAIKSSLPEISLVKETINHPWRESAMNRMEIFYQTLLAAGCPISLYIT